MRPRTEDEMDTLVRTLVSECFTMARDANLRQTDVAKLLGASRTTVARWWASTEPGHTLEDIPAGGSSSAHAFMNLMILRRNLKIGLATDKLPAPTEARRNHWVLSKLDKLPG